jgi:hypothetical protein
MPSGTMDEFLTWCSAREERLAEIAELAYRAAATPEKSKLLRVLLAEMNSHSRMVAWVRVAATEHSRTGRPHDEFTPPVDIRTVDTCDVELHARAAALEPSPGRA